MKWELFFLVLIFFAAACQRRPSAQALPEDHMIMVRQPGAALYIDRLDNRAILQRADTTGPTTFCSFLVGMRDSLPGNDAKRAMEREKYIQYGMQQNWAGVINGDSVRPLFLMEKPHLDQRLREAAMVFEIPRGRRLDTLVYRDTFGIWGMHVFVLNGK